MTEKGDPQWSKDERLSKAEIWERRAKKQLTRAQDAEDEVKALEKRVYDLEGSVALAAGSSMEEAARAFCEVQWPGEEVTDMTFQQSDVTKAKDPRRLGWRARCYVNGTGIKVDGCQLPGGFIVTGWI